MAYNHQDWETVVFKKKKIVDPSTKPYHGPSKSKILDETNDGGKMPTFGDYNNIRSEIQKQRLAQKMSQKDLANKINARPNLINDIESGKEIFHINLLTKIEKALCVKLPRPPSKKLA